MPRHPVFDESELANLSAAGLSPAEIAVALAIGADGKSCTEVAQTVRKLIDSIKNFMAYRGLFALRRRSPSTIKRLNESVRPAR